jgi:hypothetical protein
VVAGERIENRQRDYRRPQQHDVPQSAAERITAGERYRQMGFSRRSCSSDTIANKNSGNPILSQGTQEANFVVETHATAMPVDAKA